MTPGEVLPARNFYIALHDRAEENLTFPYFVDEVDAHEVGAAVPVPGQGSEEPERRITDLVRLVLSGVLGIAARNKLESMLDVWRARRARPDDCPHPA